jgi:hypothetical protein
VRLARYRRLAAWLRFVAADPDALGWLVVVFGAAFAFLAAVIGFIGSARGPALGRLAPYLGAAAIFAASVLAAAAVTCVAAERLTGRRARPSAVAAALLRLLRHLPRLLLSRGRAEGEGERPFLLPAVVCDGMTPVQAAGVSDDLERAYAPLVAEIRATAEQAVAAGLLALVAGYGFALWNSTRAMELGFILRLAPLALGPLAVLGAAVQAGWIAAYVYVTRGEAELARLLPLLQGIELARAGAHTRMAAAPAPRFEPPRPNPLAEAAAAAGLFVLVAGLLGIYFPGSLRWPVQLLGRRAEGTVSRVLASERKEAVEFQFQATPGYAPTVRARVAPRLRDTFRLYQPVKVRYVPLYPDWAVLEEDGGQARLDGVVVLILAGAAAAYGWLQRRFMPYAG